jgi:hypothetical protein
MLDMRMLGTPVQSTGQCSKCGEAIPDDHIRLMLMADGGNLVWVLCKACEDKTFAPTGQVAPWQSNGPEPAAGS